MLRTFIAKLLDDDEGITSEAYAALLDYLADIGEFELLEELNNTVDVTDNRYYFPSNINMEFLDA